MCSAGDVSYLFNGFDSPNFQRETSCLCHMKWTIVALGRPILHRLTVLRHIWKTTGLKKQFASTQDILDEMRSIRCIEHNGRAKFITPFVGAQKDTCKAFGFDIPEGCGTEYRSRKVSPKRRGRPAKAKTVKLES